MASVESIKYSLRNLRKSKSRSFLTILSIFAGIATIFIFVSFGFGLYNYIDEFSTGSSADKVLIQPGSGNYLDDTFSLDDSDIRAVKKTPGVIDVSGSYYNSVSVKSKGELRYTFLISYDPSNPLMLDMFNVGVEKGRLLMENDFGKAVLGYNYLLDNNIFSKGLEINDKIEINGEDVKIIGFFESVGNPADDSQIYITNDYYKNIYGSNSSYGMIVARVEKKDIADITERIENNLRKSRNLDEGQEDFTVQSFEDMIDSFSSALDIVIGFIILIALISVIVSAVNTANTMITSVLERYKEIGILKAIGARNSEIFSIFLFESAFLGFVAGLVGVGVGYLATFIAGNVLTSLGWGFLQPFYSWQLFAGCLLFAVVTGAISGVIPAINASKINTVDALRYE